MVLEVESNPHKLTMLSHMIEGELQNVEEEVLCSSLTRDSRKVKEGTLFVAVPGTEVDGHEYIDAAFSNGASAVVVEKTEVLGGRPGILVPDARRALSALAALFAEIPSEKLQVIGITGTNGKSSTAWMASHILNSIGTKTLSVGTLGVMDGTKKIESLSLTSPGPLELQGILKRAAENKYKIVVMETSAHALEQKRHDHAFFVGAAFTNLTRDHLDYFGTEENYYRAKQRLFTLLSGGSEFDKFAVVNADNKEGEEIIERFSFLNVISFGRSESASLRIDDEKLSALGQTFNIHWQGQTALASLPLIGKHNAENALAAVGIALGLGFSFELAVKALANLPQVPGRLEHVGEGTPAVYVDYAHTPDALSHALKSVREAAGSGKVWAVFGCGGDRDRGKRSEMGEVAASLADNVIVTSDNPRSEDPLAIISDIKEGINGGAHIESDRALAIGFAIANAAPDDSILIAGKGHEDYQIVGDKTLAFSDVEVADTELNKKHEKEKAV